MSKVIVIIGASSGIGKMTLVKLMAQDHIVYNLSRTKVDKLDTNIYCDVSKVDTIKYTIEEVIKKENKIDALIYCAGVSMASPIEDVREEDYRYLYEVILFGYIETLKSVIPIFKINNGGRVIFLSSIASRIPIPYDPYYSSAKASVEMFNNTINLELNKNYIYITNLIFSGVKTNFTYKRKVYDEKVQDSDFYKSVYGLAEIEQTGKDSEDIANAILKILETKKPPLNYVVGIKDKVTYKLSKIIPNKFINKLVKLKLKLKN